MRNGKKIFIISTTLFLIVFFGVGTIAYFRRVVNGRVTGNAGKLYLVVNDADSVLNENFSVSLNNGLDETYIYPGDSGVFDLNIDSTGSSSDVEVTISMSRINLPDNLKFYLDENHTKELVTRKWLIEKSNNMTKTIPIYWYWDGSVDEANDSLFIGQILEARVSISATVYKSFIQLLIDNSQLDTSVDFSTGSSSTNGLGLMMRDGTQNDLYPIVYYRGDVTNNNVIYGGFCWLIVRTTETGGIKLLYNGLVNEDGSCNNYSGVGGEDANLAVYPFINYKNGESYNIMLNEKYASPVYSGYMYNDDNTYFSVVGEVLDTSGYEAHLDNNTVDSETGRHLQNKYDSVIKTYIDSWYEENLLNTEYESLLEDTVWCADRGITSSFFLLENYQYNTVDALGWDKAFPFSAISRLWEPIMISTLETSPSLSCNRGVDRFTVDRVNGNGDLTYKIGMITADEAWLAGNISILDSTDLVTAYSTVPEHYYWTMSPLGFVDGRAHAFSVRYGQLVARYVNNDQYYGVRPSVSLKNGTLIQGGDGSFDTPYVVY